MAAIIMLARSELRRRWRSAIALTLFVGVVGGIVVASAAGAERSSTALDRFVSYSHASNAQYATDDPTASQLNAFRRIPEVADFAVLHAYGLSPHGLPNLGNAATIDGKLGRTIDRARLIKGRVANPDAADEITIGEGLASRLHLGIGDHLIADSVTPAQLALASNNQNPGTDDGPEVSLRIVGIVRRPLDLGDLAASGGVVIETPAFDRAYRGKIGTYGTILRVRTHGGAADVPKITTAARRIFGGQLASAEDVSAETRGGQDAINVLTLALWVFAGVAAVAGAVAVAIVLSRDVADAERDQSTLATLGLTRRARIATVGLRVLVVAIGGVIVATAIAVAASSRFPIGIARRAEPTPGLRIDGVVLALGVAGIIGCVVLVGLLAAIRATKLPSTAATSRAGHSRPTLAEQGAKAGLRPSITNGLRLALEPGRGAKALPVRTAVLGAVFGVMGLTAVLVFGASLGHLDATPRLYGWTWDFKAADDSFTTTCGANDFGIAHQPGVKSVAAVCYESLQVDGRPTTGWGFTPVRGAIEPEVVSGRAPSGPTEVALGAATLHALHKQVGDTVRVRGPKATRSYKVVGQIVLPEMQVGQAQPLADGAAFTGGGFAPFVDRENRTRYLVADFASKVDHAAVLRRVDATPELHAPPGEAAFVADQGVAGPTRPPEVDRLRQIDWFPPVIAGLIALLALVAIGHTVITTTRRRRSELAVLKTLGFERRQVRATLAWQTTTLAAVGLLVGIPLGAVLGTLVWRGVADSLGISSTSDYPTIALVLSVPVVIALFNLVGFWPARVAARTPPGAALMVE